MELPGGIETPARLRASCFRSNVFTNMPRVYWRLCFPALSQKDRSGAAGLEKAAREWGAAIELNLVSQGCIGAHGKR
eukprot:scaffold684_cov345-Pavlova_lutheri.AAC.9